MGMKPRKAAPEVPRNDIPRLLLDVAEAWGPCMDDCPNDGIVPHGWCVVCRCYAARARLIAEAHR